MLDWITVTIEVVGVAILLAWIVIPIQEFRQILRAVKHTPHPSPEAAADDASRTLPPAGDGAAVHRAREDGPDA